MPMYNVPMATFVSYSQCTSPQLLSKKHLKNSQAFKLVTLIKCWFNIWENICDLGTNIYSLGSNRYLHFAAMPAIMYMCCTIMHSWIRNRNTAALYRQFISLKYAPCWNRCIKVIFNVSIDPVFICLFQATVVLWKRDHKQPIVTSVVSIRSSCPSLKSWTPHFRVFKTF